MPGRASLLAGQYYAHPRNAFWAIIEAVYGIEARLAYDDRCARLRDRKVAVWDVLKTCTRTGSLDSDIDTATLVPNDFTGFLSRHPRIRVIYFNGTMAAETFRRHVQPALPGHLAELPGIRLPSTSPAHASFSFQRKLEAWRVIAG